MNEIWDAVMSQNVTLAGAVFKLLLSFVLGSAVGLERRRKGQVAGMRTFSLICMGATLAMLVSIYIPQEYLGLKNGDPGRIAAQVISGIGFLGAGAIIQMKGSVKGLTTAAGIWMTAAIGLSIGAGMYAIAIVATLLVFFVLTAAERYEHRVFRVGESKIVRVKVGEIVEDLQPFRDDFQEYGIHVVDEFIKYNYHDGQSILNFIVLTKGQPDFIRLFSQLRQHGPVDSITLTNEVNN